jgi:hypothetical protein
MKDFILIPSENLRDYPVADTDVIIPRNSIKKIFIYKPRHEITINDGVDAYKMIFNASIDIEKFLEKNNLQ